MRLAPGVFTRGDILRFSKVGRALIKVCLDHRPPPEPGATRRRGCGRCDRSQSLESYPVNGLTQAREPI